MNKNVRVESTICEYNGQTPSSAHQARKFHKKANFFMFQKDVSTEMGSHVTSRCMVTGCDGRGDVTTTYGF